MSPRPRAPSGTMPAPAVRRHWCVVAGILGLAALAVACAKGSGGGASTGSGGAQGSASGGAQGSASGGASGSGSGGAAGSGGSVGTGSGGASGSGSGGSMATASGGASPSGGASGSGSGGSMGIDDGGVTDAACQMATVMFAPKIPTVTLLVDRSGSMFHCLTGSTGDALCADPNNTSWHNLKVAIEAVITQLDGQVRFGFATVWGTNPASGGMCPSLQGMTTDVVAPALNNAAAIAKIYDGLPLPPQSSDPGKKFESPASESIAVAAKALMADASPGGKYIIFLTDGQPDYCDDSPALCATDSVVFQLQNAFAASIRTIVFGVQTPLFDLAPGVLQSFANAGAGEPTLAPVKTGGSANDFYDQCNGNASWAADLTASGKPKARGSTLGTYMTTMGPTTPYTPSASNQSQLVTQLLAAISGVKDCTFDLGNLGGQSIKVDPAQLGMAHVCLGKTCPDTTEVAQDATNGWSMASATQLVLNGTACEKWRMPSNNDISFDFPCKSIIFE
jgi:hypothetical protein